MTVFIFFFFFSSRRRHTRLQGDWSSDVCSSDLVAFCGRREVLGGEVVQQIKDHGGEATYIRADVRNESEVKNFIDRTVATYGRLDVAFNNAGITLEKPLHEYSSGEWDDVTNTNLRGA